MQPMVEAAVKSYSQTGTGELVRLRDGEMAFVGLKGIFPNEEKLLACFPTSMPGMSSFFAHSINYDDEVLSFGKNVELYFDPMVARIEPSMFGGRCISGALLIGPHTWAISVSHPDRSAVLGGLEVTIRENSEYSYHSRTRFAVLDWELRLRSVGMVTTPIYTFHAAS